MEEENLDLRESREEKDKKKIHSFCVLTNVVRVIK
jgi:hypothetical protein